MRYLSSGILICSGKGRCKKCLNKYDYTYKWYESIDGFIRIIYNINTKRMYVKEGEYMARNKYPEITVEKILEVSQRLFLEKGYDNTTIQDIVDELDGLSKGAIYHHFKSKEEIMDALGDRMFFNNNPFEKVKQRTDLNGLEKMRMAILLNQSDDTQIRLTEQAIPMLKNPHVLARMIETNRRRLCPYWLEFIEEGCRDGSIQTVYAKELSEFLVLMDIWLIPSVFPADKEAIKNRFRCIKEMLEKMGLPLLNEEVENKLCGLPYFAEE